MPTLPRTPRRLTSDVPPALVAALLSGDFSSAADEHGVSSLDVLLLRGGGPSNNGFGGPSGAASW